MSKTIKCKCPQGLMWDGVRYPKGDSVELPIKVAIACGKYKEPVKKTPTRKRAAKKTVKG